jgi:protein O-mannosyl-transferase
MTERWTRWRTPEVMIALLALVSSGLGVLNRFAYDDVYVIEQNPIVHTLRASYRLFAMPYWPIQWGGDGYRPLTMLAFRLEWAIGHGAPVVFHAANILLYIVTSVLVFWLARRLLPLTFAWLAAALFAVHPVHVEAVANVVGQSELLVACALVGATLIYLRERQRGQLRPWGAVAIAFLYAVACFAKEHGIVLPAILVAAELTVLEDAATARQRIARLRPFYLALLAVAIAFIGVRSLVLADHAVGGFAPFTPFAALHTSPRDRILTALGVVPHWVRLLFWPARLSSDWGPPEIEIAQGLRITQLPGFLLLAAILALAVVLRRRQRTMSFGICFAAITLLPSSNFILPAGIVLAERTLLLPSVGAMLILGELASLVVEAVGRRAADTRRLVITLATPVAVILVLGAARSAQRTRVWHDNDVLLRQAVIDLPGAYHPHYMLGAWDFRLNRLREGEIEIRKALSMFPYDPMMALNMAEQYAKLGMCKPALPLYRWARGLEPSIPGNVRFALCLSMDGEHAAAKAEALEAMAGGGNVSVLHYVISAADSAKAARSRFSQEVPVAVSGGHGKAPETMQKAVPGTPSGSKH